MFDQRISKRQAQRSLARLQRGLRKREILREYQLQLYRLGQILDEKSNLLRRAAKFFALQFMLYFTSLAALLVGRAY